jgi:hypothetical protein
MVDKSFGSAIDALNAMTPADGGAMLTPDNDADLAIPTRGIAFGTAGALKVTLVGGDVVTIPSGVLATGMVHWLRIKRLWGAPGTTATNILGVW